jgi:hypothetical protein
MTLETILQEMLEQIGNGDYDQAHWKADQLLCELVRVLALELDENTQQLVQQISEAYDKVGKWYA